MTKGKLNKEELYDQLEYSGLNQAVAMLNDGVPYDGQKMKNYFQAIKCSLDHVYHGIKKRQLDIISDKMGLKQLPTK